MQQDDRVDRGYRYVPLSHYVGVIVRSWLLIAVVTAVFGIVAAVMVARTPRTYQARTQLLVTQPVAERVVDGTRPETLSIDVLLALGQATDLFEKVAEAADLRNSDTGRRLSSQTIQAATQLTLVRIEDTESLPLLSLTVTSEDPERAAVIANTWAAVFISESSRFASSEATRTFEFASSRFDEVSAELGAKEQELLDVRLENPIESLSSQLTVVARRYTTALARLEADRESLVTEQTRLASAEEAFATEEEFIEVESTIPTEVLLLLAAVDDQGFDPEAFPGLVARSQEPNELYFALKDAIVAGRSEVATLTARIAFLEADVARMDAEIATLSDRIGRVEVTTARLEREIAFLTDEFTSLGEAAQAAQIAAAEESGSILIVEAAVAPTSPTSRGGMRTLMLAGLLGLFVGGLVALLRSSLRENPAPAKARKR